MAFKNKDARKWSELLGFKLGFIEKVIYTYDKKMKCCKKVWRKNS